MRIKTCESVAALLFTVLAVGTIVIAKSSVKPRLYVTNSLGDDISVIDLQTLKVIADIKVGKQVHGVCGPSDGRHVFTTVESENALKIIDTRSQGIVATIHLTGTPNQCASTPDGRYVAVPIHTNEIDIVDVAE
jgi:YVTN family beta-propeller protein